MMVNPILKKKTSIILAVANFRTIMPGRLVMVTPAKTAEPVGRRVFWRLLGYFIDLEKY